MWHNLGRSQVNQYLQSLFLGNLTQMQSLVLPGDLHLAGCCYHFSHGLVAQHMGFRSPSPQPLSVIRAPRVLPTMVGNLWGMGTLSTECPRTWKTSGESSPALRPGLKMFIWYPELQLGLCFSMVEKYYNNVSGTWRVTWEFVGWLGCEVEMEHNISKGSRFQTPDLADELGQQELLLIQELPIGHTSSCTFSQSQTQNVK